MRYLTNQFVEALGLPKVAVTPRANYELCGFVPANATKPRSGMEFRAGALYKGQVYLRHASGLSWDRS